MPDFAAAFKAEVSRIARKELRQVTQPLRKALALQRGEIAQLKRHIAALEKTVRATTRTLARAPAKQAPKDGGKIRFSAKGLRSHRVRLGLSAQELGKLLGVSAQTIYNWETGKSLPRTEQKVAIGDLRTMGKRQAAAALKPTAAEPE
jgi:DNA-binding XRE family transcriptional regulator